MSACASCAVFLDRFRRDMVLASQREEKLPFAQETRFDFVKCAFSLQVELRLRGGAIRVHLGSINKSFQASMLSGFWSTAEAVEDNTSAQRERNDFGM